MTETTKPRIGEPIAVLRHSDAAAQWATSEHRTVVFSVTRPNPDREGWENEAHAEGEVVDPPPAELRHDYTMPATPNAGLGLAYLKRARENADVAMSWLIETAIGSDGYDALTDELSGVTDANEAQRILQGVVERIQRVALGGLDAPKA